MLDERVEDPELTLSWVGALEDPTARTGAATMLPLVSENSNEESAIDAIDAGTVRLITCEHAGVWGVLRARALVFRRFTLLENVTLRMNVSLDSNLCTCTPACYA